MVRSTIVPLGVVAMLGTMIVPIPPFLLDLLLVGNLVLALLLFASTFYVVEPLKLSSLPTILLLATIFRLALNISTTRLILGSGEAGATIEAFGTIVVGGNLIVGLVIFLLITLIQFLVVAKGSERVAEVSARFTLDALPGKQMSIDADVRAGLIDFETARQKRTDLQLESRFYGALDGAMKFVKGDAIAGLIITAVNIIGGFAVGVFMEGLDLSSAVAKYTLLTVGDGLVSQVPALLNAVAAGMVVTRVGSSEGKPLAGELMSQLGQSRGVKILISGVTLVLSLCPGMPFVPFAFFSILLLVGAFSGRRRSGLIATDQPEIKFLPRLPALLGIEIGRTLADQLSEKGSIDDLLEQFRQDEFDRSGIILLKPEVIVVDSLGSTGRVRSRGVIAGEIKAGENGIDVRSTVRQMLEQVVFERRDELLDDIMTRRLLDRLDPEAPELVSAVLPAVLTVTQLTEILRALRREEISVRSLEVILQAIAEQGTRAAHERVLLEEVRIAMRRVIAQRFADPSGVLSILRLDPLTDFAFCRWELEGDEPEPELLDGLLTTLRDHAASEMVLVSSRKARTKIAELLIEHGIALPVIAHEEIPPRTALNDCGLIEVDVHPRIDRIAA